jgi:dihydroorotate dehydrogenase
VQVGTAHLYDPNVGAKIVNQIKEFLSTEGITDVNDFIGSLESVAPH